MPATSLLIASCDAFSDIWEANNVLLNKNWADRDMQTILVTETDQKQTLQGVSFVYSGVCGYADKLQKAALACNSKYIILLLDDYLLTTKISQKQILHLVETMESEGADYLRFRKARSDKKFKDYSDVYKIDLSYHRYKVNMEPSIWKRESLLKVLQGQKTAWELEASMTGSADRYGFLALSTKKKYLPYMDTIRKGNILRKAWKYLKKNDLYHGQRKKTPLKQEARLNFINFVIFVTPKRLLKKIKKRLVKHGHKYYSHWEED